MKRRSFLEAGALGSALGLFGLTSCNQQSVTTNEEQAPIGGFALEEKTVAQLQQAMESGDLTSREIVRLYLERIENLDKDSLNSVIEVNPDALSIAEQLDKERSDGSIRGPLHGIPILIKDNIDNGDKMMTTEGSLAMVGPPAANHAFEVYKQREAGAVLLGKTNLSEWAYFRSNRSSSGWSGRGRQTNNPYALDRNPCGSSSGSGVAVSANLCAIAIGTETDGSIVCPSNANGVVGIKPTVGLWSRTGIIPISHTQDTAGPMGRTVADAVYLLGPLTGEDPSDSRTLQSDEHSYKDYRQFLDPEGLKGKRIGIWRDATGFHEAVDKVLEQAIDSLRSAGAEIIDPVKIDNQDKAGPSEYQVMLYEFKHGLNRYLSARSGAQVKSLEELIQFNKDHAESSMPYFQQDRLEQAQDKGDLESNEYLEALETSLKLSRQQGIDQTLAEHELDAIMAPTGGPAWPTDKISGDHYRGGSSGPAARAGYPNISVPAGYIHGLPVGVSFFSTAWKEPELIAMAYAYEQARGPREAPQFLPTLDLK